MTSGMPVEAIARRPPARWPRYSRTVTCRRRPMPRAIEIAGCRMMAACVAASNRKASASARRWPGRPNRSRAVAEKRAVSTIVLDHEKADQQTGGRHLEQQSRPITVVKRDPDQGPDDDERYRSDRQFEDTARTVGLAITCENCADARISGVPWVISLLLNMPSKKHVYRPRTLAAAALKSCSARSHIDLCRDAPLKYCSPQSRSDGDARRVRHRPAISGM